MTPARVASALKTLGKYQIFGLITWTLGGIYVAALLTIPKLLAYAVRML